MNDRKNAFPKKFQNFVITYPMMIYMSDDNDLFSRYENVCAHD